MEKQESNKEIQSKLDLFESMENILPSEDWDNMLDRKLKINNRNTTMVNLKISLIAVILVFNVGFIFMSIFSKGNLISKKDNDLDLISKELLINAISINN